MTLLTKGMLINLSEIIYKTDLIKQSSQKLLNFDSPKMLIYEESYSELHGNIKNTKKKNEA